MNDTSRRFALRERTSSLHEAVDQKVGSFRDRLDYVRYLRGIAAFRLGVEPSLAASFPADWGDWRPRNVAGLIELDLKDLGHDAPVPDRHDTPWDQSVVLGTLYVLEGSALGAKLLYRRAREIGFDGSFGARHLAALSADVTSWRRFLEILDAADPFDLDVATEASLATFRAAEAAFESVA